MIDSDIIQIIHLYKNLIQKDTKDSWMEFYANLVDYKYQSALHLVTGPYPGEVTDVLLSSGVDPAERMGLIPGEYLSHSSLENYHIPPQAKEVEDEALTYSGIQSLYIPSTVTYLGASACYRAQEISKVFIEEGGKLSIREFTFADMPKLYEVSLPKDIQFVDPKAFLVCPKLNTLTFRGTVSEWQEMRFKASNPKKAPIEGISKIICIDGESLC